MKRYLQHLIQSMAWRFGYTISRTNTFRTGLMSEFAGLPFRSILDIGASDGDTAKQFLADFPDAHIYAFEPLPQPFAALQRLSGQHADRLSAFQLALGAEEGEIEMHAHTDFDKSSSLLATTATSDALYPHTVAQKPVKVRVATLDQWFREQSSPPQPEMLVKMDCQGYEDRVLKGGMETLKKAKVCILEVFFRDLYKGQATFRDIFTILDSLGFRYHGNFEQGVSRSGLVQADVMFVR